MHSPHIIPLHCVDRYHLADGVFWWRQVEAAFKAIWANHGDDISLQYAGTGALKSGFTRTGVRTKAGMLDDGVKSGLRYYRNNFKDGTKQDALDLITGTYLISKGKRRLSWVKSVLCTACRVSNRKGGSDFTNRYVAKCHGWEG